MGTRKTSCRIERVALNTKILISRKNCQEMTRNCQGAPRLRQHIDLVSQQIFTVDLG